MSVKILPHAVTHQAGGSDEINVEGLKGVLADLQKAKWSVYDTRANFPAGEEVGALAYATDEKTLYRWNGASWEKVLSLDLMELVNRLHAATHESGGDDPIDFLKLTNRKHASKHESGGDDEINVDGLHGELADYQKTTWDKVDGKPSCFTPCSHASSHQAGGSDEINVAGLHGELADPQPPKAHASSHEAGGSDEINVSGLKGELADPQPPKAHAASHKSGGSDELPLNTLPVTGDLYMGGHSIKNVLYVDGVDVSSHAARHKAGGADPLRVGELAGIEFKHVQIISGVPADWAIIDLSSHVGDRRAVVCIKIDHPGTSNRKYLAIPADWGSNSVSTNFDTNLGPWACFARAGGYAHLITYTDSYGRIRVWTDSGESGDKWYLEWYIALE